jgi:hypothetical protein
MVDKALNCLDKLCCRGIPESTEGKAVEIAMDQKNWTGSAL